MAAELRSTGRAGAAGVRLPAKNAGGGRSNNDDGEQRALGDVPALGRLLAGQLCVRRRAGWARRVGRGFRATVIPCSRSIIAIT